MLISIVTPVTGNPLMRQAIQSVQDQDYDDIEHLIVIDGKEREENSQKLLKDIEFKKKRTHILCLPYATGKDRFISHRIYGASCYLINGEYITFLDEDNWFDINHISALVETVYEQQLDWAYSLRKIVDPKGVFIANDDCESLGKWIAFTEQYHHVDTNCFFIKKTIAINYSPIWYRRFREPGLMNADMALCNQLLEVFPHCDTTGLYSVNYRLGSSPLSVKKEFFLTGNQVMRERYLTGFPWQNSTTSLDHVEDFKKELPLREINWIAFPNWADSETNITKILITLLQALLKYPEKKRLTLFLDTPDADQEKANALLWEAISDCSDWVELENFEIPEIYLLPEMNPFFRQVFTSLLKNNIVLTDQKSDREEIWKIDHLPLLNLENI
jgi:glycosyltransferase involved in cell wall biosynthesis